MILGQVTGAVWATRKCAALQGQTFLEVRYPGGTVVAADLVGAGLGDPVLVTLGSGARAGQEAMPLDAAIVAILDEETGRRSSHAHP